jgi:TPR repeat protein
MLDDSPVRAAQAILMAAREGVVDAQALLGQILLDGRGIERMKRWPCAGSRSRRRAGT